MRRVTVAIVLSWLALLSGCATVKPFDPLAEDAPILDKQFPIAAEEVVFTTVDDVKLYGLLYLAPGRGPHATIVVARGFPDPGSSIDIVQPLRRAGFNALIFFYRGFWGMRGEYTMMNSLEDLRAAVRFVRARGAEPKWRVDAKRIVLMGYSFGGPISLKAASDDPGIGGLVLIDPRDLRDFANLSEKGYADAVGWIDGTIGVHAFGKRVIDEIIAQQAFWDPLAAVRGLSGKCVLGIWATKGEGETLVAPSFPEAMRPNEHFRAVTMDTTHGFSDHRVELQRTIVSWAQSLQGQACLPVR